MSAALSNVARTACDLADGVHYGVPAGVYFAPTAPTVLGSKSLLDHVQRSPAHARAAIVEPAEPTEALEFGAAAHAAILEPEVFAREWVEAPDFGDLRFKENKARRDDWKAEHAGKRIVSADTMRAIRGMAASVYAHPRARALLSSRGRSEVTARWTDPATGVSCKARADFVVERLGLVVDLKTTQDARAGEFAKSVARYRYHVQHAFYADGFTLAGLEVEDFAFVAVEKAAPFACSVFVLDPDAVLRGRAEYERNLETLAQCVRSGEWPAYGTEIETLSLPRWA